MKLKPIKKLEMIGNDRDILNDSILIACLGTKSIDWVFLFIRRRDRAKLDDCLNADTP